MAQLYDDILSRSNGPYFRILTLLPSATEVSIIQCRLNTVALSDNTQYEALSYCWGDAANKRAIECNGITFMATENLHAALIKLRFRDKPRILWVDAICINQANLVERAQQVQHMQHIYHQATQVIVWLGPEYEGSELAFSLSERIAKGWVKLRNDTLVGRWKDPLEVIKEDWAKRSLLRSHSRMEQLWGHEVAGDAGSVLTEDPGWRSKSHEPPDPPEPPVSIIQNVGREDGTMVSILITAAFEDEFYAFMKLIRRAWWTRSWIVQEICLAREVILACGDATTSWDALSIAVLVTHEGGSGDMMATTLSNGYALSLIRSKAKRGHSGESLDLLEILEEYRSLDATDPRDKVYAFLGLVPPTSTTHLQIKPDYQIDKIECFLQAALTCLRQRDNLDLLSIERYPSSGLASSLPSWVPDWSFSDPKSVALPSQILETETSGSRPYRASGVPAASPISTDPSNPRVLLLTGFVHDQLDKLEEPLPTYVDLDAVNTIVLVDNLGTYAKLRKVKKIFSSQGHYSRVCIQWDRLAMEATSYPTGEDPLRVFCATFCAGYMRGGEDITFQGFVKWRAGLEGPQRTSRFGKLGSKLLSGGWYHMTHPGLGGTEGNTSGNDGLLPASEPHTLDHYAVSRRLARTSKDYLGLVPKHAQPGDKIALCRGSKLPLILRPLASGQWELVGCAYVHGLMNGEAWNEELCQSIRVV